MFLLVSGFLYFYSASYKRQFLIGNILVAVLAGLLPVLVAVFEWPALYRYYSVNAVELPDIDIIFFWVGGFSVFAFLSTLNREIVKDIEDVDGDMVHGRNTVPIVMGLKRARIVVTFLSLLTVALLYVIWYLYLHDNLTLGYIFFAITAPLIYATYKVIVSSDKKALHTAGNIMKIVMLTGILYSLVAEIILTSGLIV